MTDTVTLSDDFMRSLGVEAYRVGGSVRDQILGRKSKDADYMVRGVSLKDLGRMLRARTSVKTSPLVDREQRPLGWRVRCAAFGEVEITLPRVEVSTGPGHRDFDITLDPLLPLDQDALRRDFTFNALYLGVFDSPGGGVVADPTGAGLYDLQHRLVRTTHESSFRDDPLRILRALRFVSTLGYDLSANTLAEMREHADAVDGLTAPKVKRGRMDGGTVEYGGGTSGTVFDEFNRILGGPDVAKALTLGEETGVLSVALPELAPMIGFGQRSKYHDMTTSQHTFKALETAAHVDAPLRVRWALLFHDSGKPDAAWLDGKGRQHYYAKGEKKDHEVYSEQRWRAATERLNVPKNLRESVATIVRNHMVTVEGKVKGTKVRRMRVQFGDDLLRDLYLHRMCDLSGKGVRVAQNHIAQVARMEQLRQEAQAEGVPCTTKDLAITGKDLAANPKVDNRNIGKLLDAVLDAVVTTPGETTYDRDWQLSMAGKFNKELA